MNGSANPSGETLGTRQRRFLPLVAKLIEFAYQQPGVTLKGGELLRTPEQAMLNAASGAGISNSLHILSLAIDLMLFRDGVWIKDSAEYKFLGEFWKTLDVDACWGGDFHAPLIDGGHFSLSYNNVR